LIRKSKSTIALSIVVAVALVLAGSYLLLEQHRDLKYLSGAGLPLDRGFLELVDKTYESHQFGASSREIFEYRLPSDVSGVDWCGDFGFSEPSEIVIAGSGKPESGCRKSNSDDSGTSVSYTLTRNRLYIKILI
jgi:hypothetical protein